MIRVSQDLPSLGFPRLRSSARFLLTFLRWVTNRHGRISYGTAEVDLVSFSHSIIVLVWHLLPRNLVACPEKDHGLDGHGGDVSPCSASVGNSGLAGLAL